MKFEHIWTDFILISRCFYINCTRQSEITCRPLRLSFSHGENKQRSKVQSQRMYLLTVGVRILESADKTAYKIWSRWRVQKSNLTYEGWQRISLMRVLTPFKWSSEHNIYIRLRLLRCWWHLDKLHTDARMFIIVSVILFLKK